MRFPLRASAVPVIALALSASAQRSIFFYQTERSVLEREVHDIPQTDAARFLRLRSLFEQSDCRGERMEEQMVRERHGQGGRNLICVWPGNSTDTIVIAAHYQLPGKGEGALDDWSGAVLLPVLYAAIQAQARDHTFVFLENWGMGGAKAYLDALTRDQKRNIRAMIDLDGLGMGETKYYSITSLHTGAGAPEWRLQQTLVLSAQAGSLREQPTPANPQYWLRSDDSYPFRLQSIPTIFIHSVAENQFTVPASARDTAAAISTNAYFQSAKLLCIYLIELDALADDLEAADAVWEKHRRTQFSPPERKPPSR